MHDVLAIDPGAKRGGWAVLNKGPKYVASGVIYCDREKNETYQDYRLRLTKTYVPLVEYWIKTYTPKNIVTEIVPAYGMNDNGQGYLANVMATTVHAVALSYVGAKVSQVSAKKVQNKIAVGKKKKISKVQVRNGVVSLLPGLKEQAKGWTKIFEEPDAIAIGLEFLGYTN